MKLIRRKAESLCMDIIAKAKSNDEFKEENFDIVEVAQKLYNEIQEDKREERM